MKKHVLALLLALCCALPVGAGAAVPTNPEPYQIEETGGTKSQTAGQSGANYDITISKTADLVTEGTENFFDVTLTVDTHTHVKDTSTDVVIVLDISNTMNSPIGDNTAPPRIREAKNAAKAFVNHLATQSQLTSRQLALVTFNTNATTVSNLVPLNSTASANSMNQKIDDISTDYGSDTSLTYKNNRWTNIEAGLQMAYNLLQNSSAAYKYVVLFTDGFPTTYISSGRNSLSTIAGYPPITEDTDNVKLSAQADGYFAYTLGGKHTVSGGVNYSNKGAVRAQDVASKLKNAGVDVFSVGIDIGGQQIQDNIDDFPKAPLLDTVGISSLSQLAIGTSEESYREWLREDIAGGPNLSKLERYFDAPSATALSTNVAKILNAIETIPRLSSRNFYVTDPMGDNIEFMYFYDMNGNAVTPSSDSIGAKSSALSGESKANKEDTATFSRTDGNKIHWDLLKSGFTSSTSGATRYFSYDLKYRVRLRNEKDGFSFNTDQVTNKPTSLNWVLTYEDTEIEATRGSMSFPIPEVEGYAGAFSFVKENADGQPLSGAQFQLIHRGTSCSICKGSAEDVVTLTSNESGSNGLITFSDIPSGHDYILRETKVPTGYQRLHDHNIRVSYGTVSLERNGQFEALTANHTFTAINTEAIPVELQLRVKKQMDGDAATTAGQFSFNISTAAGQGPYGKTINETVSNNNSGYAAFTPMILDSEGSYVLTIKEITGTDETIGYDPANYYVKIEVFHPQTGPDHLADDWHAEVSVSSDGSNFTDPITYTGAVPTNVRASNGLHVIDVNSLLSDAVFKNVSRPEAVAQLEAKKVLKDNYGKPLKLNAGIFAFALRDEDNNLIEVATNQEDGSVRFSPLTYKNTGLYRYTITELHGHQTAQDQIIHDPDFYYDYSTWEVTVEVLAHDLTNPEAFETSVSYQKLYENSSNANSNIIPTFTNVLKQPASLVIRALKTLDDEKPVDKTFEFELVQLFEGEDGEMIEEVIETVKNDEDGYIKFTKLEYDASPLDRTHTAVGRYLYLVREVIPEKITEQIVYDPVVYYLDVLISDEHNPVFEIALNVYQLLENMEPELYASYHGQDLIMEIEKPVTSPDMSNESVPASTLPLLFANVTYDLPATGDGSSLLAWGLILAASVLGLIAYRKRRTN